jgi:NAD(P)-dependent dehydrogenase (short-subunit alcohol dehydrogenase family)
MELQQKTIVVVGGASGLGAACVRLLTQAGARVAILDLNAETGEALAAELGEAAHFIKTDVTDETSVDSAMEKASSFFCAVHGAISCAGIAPAEKILGKQGLHSLATFTNVINVNLIGTFNVIRSAARVIAENQPSASGERGVIINTASVAAFDGQIGQAAYSASKGGIVAMTLPIARELAR